MNDYVILNNRAFNATPLPRLLRSTGLNGGRSRQLHFSQCGGEKEQTRTGKEARALMNTPREECGPSKEEKRRDETRALWTH